VYIYLCMYIYIYIYNQGTLYKIGFIHLYPARAVGMKKYPKEKSNFIYISNSADKHFEIRNISISMATRF
jgi:hypothetical protein